MLIKLKKTISLILAAVMLLAPSIKAQGVIGVPPNAMVDFTLQEIRLKAKRDAVKERLKKEPKGTAFAKYLKASGDDWKALPYYKLNETQFQDKLITTAETVGDLLKGSPEYIEYQVGRWLKYVTVFVLFAISIYGLCAWLGPAFAEAGLSVIHVGGLLPAVCNVNQVGASLFWSVMLSGSAFILTDVLKNTYDIFSRKLFGQTYEEHLGKLKEMAATPQASAEDMASLFKDAQMPMDWNNQNQHKQYLQLLYAFEAISQEMLLGDKETRYQAAWLDIMALASGLDLPEDRVKVNSFIRQKNQEYKDRIAKVRQQEKDFNKTYGQVKLGAI